VLQHVSDHRWSGSLVQCMAKNYKNDSIVSVDMDKVGVMAAYCDQLCVCVVNCIWRHFINSELHTHAQRVTICCHNTDHVHVNGHDRTIFFVILTRNCTRLPHHGSCVIPDMLEHFKYFIILIVSTNYIFVHLLDNKKCFNRHRCTMQKHEKNTIHCNRNLIIVAPRM